MDSVKLAKTATMAASKAKGGVNSDLMKDVNPAELAPNSRTYNLDELETVATVGELTLSPGRGQTGGVRGPVPGVSQGLHGGLPGAS